MWGSGDPMGSQVKLPVIIKNMYMLEENPNNLVHIFRLYLMNGRYI